MIIANAYDAHHPIRHAFTEQAIKEASSLLLGGLPEIWWEWEAKAGDDSRCVSCNSLKFQGDVLIEFAI